MTRRAPLLVGVASALLLGAGTASVPAAGADPGQARAATAAEWQPPEHLDQWWFDAMGLADAQATANGGEGARVALFDSYLDTTVPDLQGADITIRRGCEGTRTPRVTGPEADHGTAMATAIVGQGTGNGPGGKGVLGVAPRATLDFYSVEADHDDGKIDCSGYYFGQMIDQAVDRGADVISISLGGGLFGGMEEEITRAVDKGAVVVVAAGDRRDYQLIDIPATDPGVVSVGAGDSDARTWEFNPDASPPNDLFLYLISPGVDTEIGGFDSSGQWRSGATRSGTSGANAIAAGAFALAAAAYPDATGKQLIQAAVQTARDDGGMKYQVRTGYGAMRVNAMLQQDPAGWPDENPLLMRPRQAMRTYPASSYVEPGAEAEGADQGADEGGTDEGAEAGAAGADGPDDDAAAADGPPVAALAAGGALGLVVLGGAAVLARRRRTDDPAT